jgi:hypothetical protein
VKTRHIHDNKKTDCSANDRYADQEIIKLTGDRQKTRYTAIFISASHTSMGHRSAQSFSKKERKNQVDVQLIANQIRDQGPLMFQSIPFCSFYHRLHVPRKTFNKAQSTLGDSHFILFKDCLYVSSDSDVTHL